METFIDLFNANRHWVLPGLSIMLMAAVAREVAAFLSPDAPALGQSGECRPALGPEPGRRPKTRLLHARGGMKTQHGLSWSLDRALAPAGRVRTDLK